LVSIEYQLTNELTSKRVSWKTEFHNWELIDGAKIFTREMDIDMNISSLCIACMAILVNGRNLTRRR